MRGRSWTAGLARSVGVAVILGVGAAAARGEAPRNEPGAADAPNATAGAAPAGREEAPTQTHPVRLLLRIAGLGAEGCDVVVKPANPSCRFRPVARHVGSSGELGIDVKDMEVRSVNRNCSLSITLTEPGQKPRTVLRGFRLESKSSEPGAPGTIQTFACFLSSPSKLARIEESKTIRR